MQAKTTVRWVLCVLVVAAAAVVAVLSHSTTVASKTPDVTSSTVNLRWQPITGANQVRVYLLPDTKGTKTLLATLPGTAASHRVDGLAPCRHGVFPG